MYQKFIITQDGILRFGSVYNHRDLLHYGENCTYGGGLWQIDDERQAILLYGRSFEFGSPDFSNVRKIDWNSLHGKCFPLFFLPKWPQQEILEPIYVNNNY